MRKIILTMLAALSFSLAHAKEPGPLKDTGVKSFVKACPKGDKLTENSCTRAGVKIQRSAYLAYNENPLLQNPSNTFSDKQEMNLNERELYRFKLVHTFTTNGGPVSAIEIFMSATNEAGMKRYSQYEAQTPYNNHRYNNNIGVSDEIKYQLVVSFINEWNIKQRSALNIGQFKVIKMPSIINKTESQDFDPLGLTDTYDAGVQYTHGFYTRGGQKILAMSVALGGGNRISGTTNVNSRFEDMKARFAFHTNIAFDLLKLIGQDDYMLNSSLKIGQDLSYTVSEKSGAPNQVNSVSFVSFTQDLENNKQIDVRFFYGLSQSGLVVDAAGTNYAETKTRFRGIDFSYDLFNVKRCGFNFNLGASEIESKRKTLDVHRLPPNVARMVRVQGGVGCDHVFRGFDTNLNVRYDRNYVKDAGGNESNVFYDQAGIELSATIDTEEYTEDVGNFIQSWVDRQ